MSTNEDEGDDDDVNADDEHKLVCKVNNEI